MSDTKIKTLDAFLLGLEYAPDEEAVKLLCEATTPEVLEEYAEYMKTHEQEAQS